MIKILAICGSTKSNSTNLTIIKTLQELSAGSVEIILYDELTALPFFNPDLDNDRPPTAVVRLREAIDSSDAVIITTPEYVFSLPGVLKNAIEWTVSTRVFANKPIAIITASSLGEKAHESLQLIMKTIEAKVDESTALLLQGAKSKIGRNEKPDAETIEKLKTLLQALIDQIQTT